MFPVDAFPALRFLPSAPSRHWRCSSSLSAQKLFKPKILSLFLAKKTSKIGISMSFFFKVDHLSGTFRLKRTLYAYAATGTRPPTGPPSGTDGLPEGFTWEREWSPTTKRKEEAGNPRRSIKWWWDVFPFAAKGSLFSPMRVQRPLVSD